MKFEAVFFDLYETLVTEFDPNWQPRLSAAERLGVDPAAFSREWRARQPKRLSGSYPNYPSILRTICQSLGTTPDEAVLHALQEERITDKGKPFASIDTELVSALHALREANVKLGVISNCNGPEEVAAWASCELAPLFEDMVLSYEVGCAKPEAEIYRLACERLGMTPEHSAFVGDGGFDELAGAEKAGMTPYWASWFVDRWPAWRRAQPVYKEAAAYPRLRSFREVVGMLGRSEV